jgi:glutamate-1-semialdehyde 2,1-aminomutase
VATFGIPDTRGVPASYTEKTVVLPYNDRSAVEEAFRRLGDRIACVIVEPVAGNMGVVLPADGYLPFLREITSRHGAILIFDEVITGFRLSLGGAQKVYGVNPDLTVLGKIMGGGMPAAAYGGRADIMDTLAPGGPVYQAGTLSANPVAMAAGLATLDVLREENPYPRLEALSHRLEEGLRGAAWEAGVPVCQNRAGSMQTLFFSEGPVTDYRSAKRADTKRYAQFFHGMLDRGVHLAPSQFEAGFVSTAHTDADVDRIIEAARAAMKTVG